MWIMTDRGWQRIATTVSSSDNTPTNRLRNGYIARELEQQWIELVNMNIHTDDGKVML